MVTVRDSGLLNKAALFEHVRLLVHF